MALHATADREGPAVPRRRGVRHAPFLGGRGRRVARTPIPGGVLVATSREGRSVVRLKGTLKASALSARSRPGPGWRGHWYSGRYPP
jgi:hypothetical protein